MRQGLGTTQQLKSTLRESYTHALDQMARSALTDGFLLMLLNHEDAFLALRGINRSAWGTKLLEQQSWPIQWIVPVWVPC